MTEACSDRYDDIADAVTGNLSDERRAEFEQLVRELLPKRESSSPARGRTLPKAPK